MKVPGDDRRGPAGEALRETAAGALGDPAAYQDEASLHESLTLLRREAPVEWVDAPGFEPFWAVTRHADIMEIERNHTRFLSAPRTRLRPAATERHMHQEGAEFRTLVHMDDPDHRVARAIGADWFRPRAMRQMQTRIAELATSYVDRMARLDGTCDFVTEVSTHFPLYVILSLLGLPESDFPRLLQLTQELFGNVDQEKARGMAPEEYTNVKKDFFRYFATLTADRRARPTEDLASAIANARVDGEYLSDLDAISYYIIIATAGHDTTSATIAGGLHALIENPDQLHRIQRDPGLLPLAADEMIRWTTPVKGFMRTAAEDCVLRGVPIRKGDDLFLSYVSANRDEDVFDDPFRFDAGRDPNRHLAFGFGVHHCLGAALARMEVQALFAELLPRLASVELSGTPELIATTFVGGLKTLPVRYSLKS